MIEQIQKYKIIITIALVAVGAGFVLGGSDLIRRGGGGGGVPVIKVAGRTYNDREFNHLGEGSLKIISSLGYMDAMMLNYQFVMPLSPGVTNQKDMADKFFAGRIVLRQAKEEFGIYPGDEEISNYLRNLKAFAGKDGKFDSETYQNFVSKGIGHLGMTENDLRELASDILAFEKLKSVIGAGLGVSKDVAAADLALSNQQIEGELARIDKDPYEAKLNPTDDEIKAYWENIQDQFKTEPLRKFSYIIATPEAVSDAEAAKADEKETIADAVLSDEDKKKKEAEKAKKAADLAEKKRQNQLTLDQKVDDFFTKLDAKKDSATVFEDLAKSDEFKFEVKTTELFPQSKAPAELDLKLRSTTRPGKLVDDLFRVEPTSDPLSKFSQPIAIGENQWIIARLDGEEKSRPKTFEEAKAEARDQFISEKAAEAVKKAAEEAVTKIKESLAAGKSFADAAKDAGITVETRKVTKVKSTYQPDPANEPKNLFESAHHIDPGAIAEIITESDRTFIFLVTKREVVKEENADARALDEVKSTTDANATLAFVSWITERVEAAKVEVLHR